ncbi:hypothetical protein [Pseudomonas oryzihabitans]|uniref:hypothetical protein n=1 Tax=Pseudomonas oryzihabitans TaxID=47885 RepID=UPI00128F91A9|nr:hypothetical protein [Pseudomonas psychrotolerans]
MKFVDFVSQGVEKSNRALAVINEVESVFSDINNELKDYPGFELRIDRVVSTLSAIAKLGQALQRVDSEYFEQDSLRLTLIAEGFSAVEVVGAWRQHKQGYPCTIRFSGQDYLCYNKGELIAGFQELFSSVDFGSAVIRLRARYSKHLSEKPPLTEGDGLSESKDNG